VRIASLIAWIYGGLCAGALLLIPAAAYGWMGIAEDPHAGTFAFILGLPWSLVLDALGSPPLWLSIFLVMLAMAINVLIILWFGRRRSRLRRAL
jgi:hypothetical protein